MDSHNTWIRFWGAGQPDSDDLDQDGDTDELIAITSAMQAHMRPDGMRPHGVGGIMRGGMMGGLYRGAPMFGGMMPGRAEP
jgi:hypothetical protein